MDIFFFKNHSISKLFQRNWPYGQTSLIPSVQPMNGCRALAAASAGGRLNGVGSKSLLVQIAEKKSRVAGSSEILVKSEGQPPTSQSPPGLVTNIKHFFLYVFVQNQCPSLEMMFAFLRQQSRIELVTKLYPTVLFL